MSGANGNGSGAKLTVEQLRTLKPLTAGDFYWGHKHSDKVPGDDGSQVDDPQDLMFNVVHHAAVRAGLADKDDIYGFLDRVELEDISAVFGKELTEEDSGPLAKPTGA